MFKNIAQALERIERRQRVILEQLKMMETGENQPPRKAGWLCGERTSSAARKPCCLQRGDGCGACEDELESRTEQVRENEWLENGIDNILAYQVGKKKGGEQA